MSVHPTSIAASGIGKRFGSTRALDDIDIHFDGGEVHGIVGENGAGKSTLMKILSGVERPGSGAISLDGNPVLFDSVSAAERGGVAMIHQELNLIDELTVAENIFLGRERTRFGLIDRHHAAELTRQIMNRLDTPIDPARRVGDLSLAQQQMVEIGKALGRDARVLIMDEPTAVLSRHETAALFQMIAQLRDEGVAVIYISHLLPDVLQICDRITVLRDGRIAARLDREATKSATEQQLAGFMVGRPMGKYYPPRSARDGDVVLEVSGLSAGNVVHDVSFTVRAGEILGFAGLIGAGRTETAETIAGLRRQTGGTIHLGRRAFRPHTPREAVDEGVAYLPEDRKGSGLTLDMSVVHNVTLVALREYSRLLIDTPAEHASAAAHAERLHIKAGDLRDPVGTLSGGNQQKVLLAKWLETNPRLLIVDEPTRGVDIGAREEIYQLLRKLTEQGLACIMISSDLNEVLGMSDRIAVMRGGRIVAMLDGATATEESVMHHAAGIAGRAGPI